MQLVDRRFETKAQRAWSVCDNSATSCFMSYYRVDICNLECYISCPNVMTTLLLWGRPQDLWPQASVSPAGHKSSSASRDRSCVGPSRALPGDPALVLLECRDICSLLIFILVYRFRSPRCTCHVKFVRYSIWNFTRGHIINLSVACPIVWAVLYIPQRFPDAAIALQQSAFSTHESPKPLCEPNQNLIMSG
jgi:hypothetical protein